VSSEAEIGVVVGGSLQRGLEVRLDPGASLALGEYVMAPLDAGAHVLGMVTDLSLRAAESGATAWPPPAGDSLAARLLREVLLDTAVFTQADVTAYLELGETSESSRARRLPRHFGRVRRAGQETIDRAFAVPEEAPALRLGAPLGMDEVMVHVELEKLFERSAGIFGKSGTGKTVLALQLLDAMAAAATAAPTNRDRTVALVFDMHNDYGWDLKFQGDGGPRRSLKQRYPAHVSVYTLEESVPNSDGRIIIGTRDIRPEDLEILQATAFFTDQAIELAHACESRFGRDWVDQLLHDDPSTAARAKTWKDGDEPDEVNWNQLATRLGFATGSMQNLRRGLQRIARREFVQGGAGQFADVIDHVVKTLLGGKSVVVQFGRHGADLTSYMLVANMLSRRIWDRYQQEMERARGDRAREPNRLVIVIEEAHKFVDRALAGQTIFGQIARELRKYNVTLLVIDQRPSQIDSEVLSQIGTKFCLQLDSETDIDAVIGGVTGRSALRQIVASLESKRQALVFGHALPMPVVIQPPELTRDYAPGASLRARLGAPVETARPRLY
jgi:DNA helicase HerA-like ATPase